ncbi:MAG: cofactor-independent phosphoglycerate mutase [Thermodesulfobacteriota bacterium]
MKYIILIGDGMADYPVSELEGKTPLEAAGTPNMDRLVRGGVIGIVKTVPSGFHPGSDVAALSILGYDPSVYYTGRSPLEAASMGVKLLPEDVAFRCNLVTLGFREGMVFMDDFSAGHISTEEAQIIIEYIDTRLGSQSFRFYHGKSYRHLMVWSGGSDGLKTTPPHDITGKDVEDFLPVGQGSEVIREMMSASQCILKAHTVNKEREKRGDRPANSLWFWGEGRAPNLPAIKERHSIDGAVISAVDLVKGIGIYAGLKVVDVPGATGYIDTNYKGKVEYALKELEDKDFVLIHVEAPDEVSHNGDLRAKIKAIEDFDNKIVGPMLEGLKRFNDFSVLLLSDHFTPVSLKTHTADPVPFVIYKSSDRDTDNEERAFNETSAKGSDLFIEKGDTLILKLKGRL